MMPDNLKALITRKINCNGRYSPTLHQFALTLHFYSPKAYNYVRKKWSSILPYSSTIKQWYRVVEGSPGFTKETLHAIKLRAKSSKSIVVNLIFDEMSIREQIIYNHGKFYGNVDYGTLNGENDGNDSVSAAKNALVFMAVSMNDNWKVPIGYFLIRSLNGSERAKLLIQALEMLHDSNAHVYSVTFDGAACNQSMCKKLGANLEYDPNFKPYFTNPVTMKKCFIFFDPVHMIKLVRNTLGDKKVLKTTDNLIIMWEFIVKLHSLQQEIGLKAANKLSSKHIDFSNNRMNVKLAIQTLSRSVSKSLNSNEFLITLDDDVIKRDFDGCLPTAHFCLQFNNMIDMLNCKNRFSKDKFNTALTESNYSQLKTHAEQFENYITTLCDQTETFILKCNRKTGFLGMIIGLRNMFSLFDEIKNVGLTYILTYKLSQDYLETFFSAMRARGGFNNNPNAVQFQSAYKQLLVRHEVKELENGNCLFDNIDILHVSSKNLKCPIGDANDLNNIEIDFAHDYITTFWDLSPYVENVILYIAGYVCKKVFSKIDCSYCKLQLLGTSMPLLSDMKNKGPYMIPAPDVCSICQIAEKIIRQNSHRLNTKNIKQVLVNDIFRQINIPFDNDDMRDHVMSQDILDNHRTQLCKLIITLYLNIRLFAEAKRMSEKTEYLRNKYTKLILFKNQ